jgi:hypothetical protein
VRAGHIEEGVQYAGSGSVQLSCVLRGVENSRPAASFRPPHSPVSRSMLELLADHLDCAYGLDMVVKACAMVCMWGQARLGKLLGGSVFDSSKVPRGRDLLPPVSAAGSRVLHIPFMKTTRLKGTDIILCRQRHESDPVGALLAHMDGNKVLQDEPLFSY